MLYLAGVVAGVLAAGANLEYLDGEDWGGRFEEQRDCAGIASKLPLENYHVKNLKAVEKNSIIHS